MARGNPERDLQVVLVRWLRMVLPRGSIVAAVTNEHAARSAPGTPGAIRFYEMRKAQGVLDGFSDLFLLLPEGRDFLLEVKTPRDGVLFSSQQEFRDDARAVGPDYCVCDCIVTARWSLREAGIPLRASASEPAWEWGGRKARRLRLVSQEVPF